MREYFDVVDKNDKVIGRALRSECHRNPKLIHRGVFVIVINGKGEILTQKRGSNADTNPGRWEFMGEHNKPGESYKSAALRGMKEELGIRNAKIRKLTKMKISSKRETEFDEIFLCCIGKRTVNFDRNEIKEIKFLAPMELEKAIKKKPRSFSNWSLKVFDECRHMI